MNHRHTVLLGLFAVIVLAAPGISQENGELGHMWTYEDPPLEYLKAVYGFSPSQSWLDTARLSTIKFGGGCSSSFVSERGLILTNHHCVRDYVSKVSPADADWVKDGYMARSLGEEVPVPGLTVQQLQKTLDITERMNEGIAAGDDDETINKKRTANEAAILKQAGDDDATLKHEIVKLFQGAVFKLYSYNVYKDIRLVAAPHLQAAHFGGDPDNFTYPRYGIDFALCRAYEGGKPADTSKHYFKFSANGPEEGEMVFVSGNPGRTDRAKTHAQFETMRDVSLPLSLETIDRRIEIMQTYAAEGADKEKATRTEILGLQNTQKAFRGFLAGLKDPSLMAQKQAAETAFRAKVDNDPKLKAEYSDAWARIEEICKQRNEIEPLARFQSYQGSKLLQLAFHVVRATDPTASAQARTTNKEMIEKLDLTEAPYDSETYADQLARARKWLPKDDTFLAAAVGKGDPKSVVKSWGEKSKIKDKAFVASLLDGGAEAVAKSNDPLIFVARALAPIVMENQKRRQKLDAEEAVQTARVGRALFRTYGHKIAPDATLTLRLADGVVKGYPCNGTIAPWRTSFHGLYGRNTEFSNKYPFDLSPPWLERKDKIDMNKFVNFVCTNDIIGGNSGSAVINKKQEVVGLVFDGNIESLANRYVFRDDVPRTVAVHTDAILEALTKIYDRPALAAELLGKPGHN